MKHRFPGRALLSLLVLACFGGWLAHYLKGHLDELRPIADVSAIHLFGLAALFLALIACNGLFTRDILRAYGLPLRPSVWLSLTFVSSLANYLLPLRGGAGLRAAYLRLVHHFEVSKFVSALSATYLVFTAVHGMLGLAAAVLLRLRGEAISWALGVLLAGLTASSLAVLLLRVRLPEFHRFPLREIARVVNGWDSLRDKRTLRARLFFNVAIFAAISTIQYKVAFGAYGIELRWPELLFFIAVRNLGVLVGLTPGSLGVVEGLGVYMSGQLGYGVAQILMVQAVIRAVSLGMLLLASPLCLRLLGLDSRFLRGKRSPTHDR